MRIPYSCNIMSEDAPHRFVLQFDGEIDVCREDGGWSIEGVFDGGPNMFHGDRLEKAIAHRVASIAEAEIASGGWLAQRLADEYLQAAE